ncbi:DUF6351 family protein [Halopseudomonas salegens]|uniref:DUF6351 domain-containing protein n=1 Tax=Halopseudomonas salegens TaxID=1434072 RepID=A0A1H2EBK5_9GAMM|nr:DUF6351 family protein [Halopseudomonas salegens]SDT92495.1 hypothetical protein SAMN05216210_0555 [Halopseudomonas salegens]
MSYLRFYVLPGILSAASLALGGCLSSGGSSSSSDTPPDFTLNALSSSAEQVSGGNLLLSIAGDQPRIDAEMDNLEFWLNDQIIEPVQLRTRNGRLEVLIDGLDAGDNQLELHHTTFGKLHDLAVTNHPISGPIFSGPQQYPFVCSTLEELGIQPLVDNNEGGYPVYDPDDNLIGYSKDCSIQPEISFLYRTTGGSYQPLPSDGSRPADMATTTLTDGRTVDFIVRREVGTINRFIYSFATLANLGDSPEDTATDNWNGRLLFHFEGGVAIGHSQGRVSGRALEPNALGKGYAVIYSTGTRTSTHYNLQVGGETALMTKEHFIKRFGVPDYTVAIGGSGGGIQQYVYAQNHPGLLDAGVPQYSYPDMVTQTIHIGDCELLEYYMDATDRSNPRWQTTENRSLLVGLNATDDYPDPFFGAKQMLGYSSAPGMTECVPAWRGLTPLVMNPLYGQARNQEKMQPAEIMAGVNWTHYDDLRNIYGVDGNGNPRTLFDNVGVQYGLQALKEGNISASEFLHLNRYVGGWKQPEDMIQEGFPFLGSEADVLAGQIRFDPWSSANMLLSPGNGEPAPRTQGDLQAIQAAYQSGMVFDGQLDIPVIDWRHYLEEVLDMHNSHQSFSARQRIINRMGNSDSQVIWFTDARPTNTNDPNRPRPNDTHDQTWEALEVLHDWVTNIQNNPERSIGENRPAAAVDSCFNSDGSLIEAGEGVWNGIIDNQLDGSCTQQFPTYTTSRMVAGGPIAGSIFKCSLKPVASALNDGTYGSWQPSPAQITELNEIFPDGVCDYNAADQGRPW